MATALLLVRDSSHRSLTWLSNSNVAASPLAPADNFFFPAANNQGGSRIIPSSSPEELCSWASLQMAHEKALGELQKEIMLQNEKWMHIYQLWVTKERAPPVWGHCRRQLQRVPPTMEMAAFLDPNRLPEQRPAPSHRTAPAPPGLPLALFYQFIHYWLLF